MDGKIRADLKDAQLAKDEVKVSTLRLLLSEVRNLEIQKGASAADQDVISVVQREIKKRKEAAAGFRSGGREDSAVREESELGILQTYLPAQMNSEELTKIVEAVINEMGATSITDMGKVIGSVMGKVKGQAEGSKVSEIVKQCLT